MERQPRPSITEQSVAASAPENDHRQQNPNPASPPTQPGSPARGPANRSRKHPFRQPLETGVRPPEANPKARLGNTAPERPEPSAARQIEPSVFIFRVIRAVPEKDSGPQIFDESMPNRGA